MVDKTETWNKCKDLYFGWHTEKWWKPKFDGGDGKGLKEIIAYLESLPADPLQTLEYIFAHWDELPDFYKSNTRLRQINSNIHNIIFFYKNGKGTKNKAGVSEEYIRGLIDNIT